MNVIHIIIRGNKGFVLYELHFPLYQVLYVISHDNLYLVSLIVLDYTNLLYMRTITYITCGNLKTSALNLSW